MNTSTSNTASASARRAQREAADPSVSAWVAANAGTGKTQVLTDRILRLLLSGTEPERILALTYTKAAAAEMSKRVFDRLAAWVTLPPEALRLALVDLMGGQPTTQHLVLARQLFAGAIETPGGLKVQTIHAFSERLLQRFPLEAGVPPGFSILDDRTGAELRRQATDDVLGEAALAPQSEIGRALLKVIAFAVEDQFDQLLREALSRREWLLGMAALAKRSDHQTDVIDRVYREAFGLPDGTDRHTLHATLSDALDQQQAAGLRDILRGGSATEIKLAEFLTAIIASQEPAAQLQAMRELFFTKAGGERSIRITKATAKNYPSLGDELIAAQQRFVVADTQFRALDLLETTRALIVLSDAVMTRYSHAKAARATLDFDDLIRKAQNLLLPAPGVTSPAEWVLFKLDGGLEHVLVDEAQDTSREQWSIIEALAAEFFAGGSRDEIVRTLFAVGDEKQSIYGFQGAAPEMFAAMGRNFAEQAVAAGRAWRRVPLNVSFRTTSPVLDAVDHVFADAKRTPGLTASGDAIQHIAHRDVQAGLVEIWPIERPDVVAEADAWAPLDEKTVQSPVTRLAGKIADTIKHWLDNNACLESENRPLRAGDILVLVGRRQPFAPAMVAALKARKIPVGGADRLTLTKEIGVQDLLVLGDFLTLPEDDLALATVLKSPLFGLDDDALTAIAAGRKKTLWTQLLDTAKTDARFKEGAERLLKWRSEADFLPPYEFFASLLERENDLFRTRLLKRLGSEAADPIDELLNLALNYDERQPPSLQGFLTWVRAGSPEIKRDMDQGRDEVRVMTVHGAKGLEAPIVFLPDTCASGRGSQGALLKAAGVTLPHGVNDLRLWPVKGTGDLAVVQTAKQAEADRDANERNRLLYVALTRPRDRLYIAGYAGPKDPAQDCWYHLIRGALEPHMQAIDTVDGNEVLRLEKSQSGPHDKPRRHGGDAVAALELPDWALRRAPHEGQLTVPFAPSRLAPLDSDETGEPIERPKPKHAEPAALPPGASNDTRRFLRGTLTHALFEHLPSFPPATWDNAAARFLDTRGAELPANIRKSIAREALVVLRHPRFSALFGPDSQAEVPIVAEIPRPDGKGPPLKLTGQIDRLARVGNDVLIIDYKTNRPPPLEESGVAEAYLLQLAAYRIAMRQIFPACTVTCAIVWTDGSRLMEIQSERLDAAEARLWQLETLR